MYGDNYGYRSGLNVSMVEHLKRRVNDALSIVNIDKNDCILDIGSNDATLLNHYSTKEIHKIGFDPSAEKFKQYYQDDTTLIVDFFSANELKKITDQKPKIITSISMFYDLPDPLEFVRNISEVLHPEGIWITEQSYLFAMLEKNSFDTICQEHLEYYSLASIKWMLDKADLKIINIEFNEINGGSVCITSAHKSNMELEEYNQLSPLLKTEKEKELSAEFRRFRTNIENIKEQLLELIQSTKEKGGRVFGLGASTKGNTLIQHFKLSTNHIESIGEVNSEKMGKFTPGTGIPIVNEDLLIKSNKDGDIFIVLPWHFKENFINNPKYRGLTLVFPLPNIEIKRDV